MFRIHIDTCQWGQIPSCITPVVTGKTSSLEGLLMSRQCVRVVCCDFHTFPSAFHHCKQRRNKHLSSLSCSPCFTFTHLHSVTLAAALNKQSSGATTERLRSSWGGGCLAQGHLDLTVCGFPFFSFYWKQGCLVHLNCTFSGDECCCCYC